MLTLLLDFNAIKGIHKSDETIITAAGIIRRPIPSFSTDTSSEAGRSDIGHGVYQLVNGGGDQGGGGDGDLGNGTKRIYIRQVK